MMARFLRQISEIEYESLLFAIGHLRDTFDLSKANYYLKWKKEWAEKKIQQFVSSYYHPHKKRKIVTSH